MISLVLTTIVLMAITTIFHFNNENLRYHTQRLERKENKLLTHIELILKENKQAKTKTDRVNLIVQKASELQVVHNLNIILYRTNGELLITTDSSKFRSVNQLPQSVIDKLDQKGFFIEKIQRSNFWKQANLSSYSYVRYNNERTVIIYLPYIQENTIFRNDLEDLLVSYAKMYIIIILGAIVFAFLLSRYITLSLKKIGEKLNETELNSNKPLIWNSDDEIGQLVIAYNQMVEKLEESTKQSLKSERENAWREMAKQVAHEIKNPLTPMRLQVQLLERKANRMKNEEEKETILDFAKGMLLQIDTLTRIATEFSTFAKMPKQQLKEVDFNDFTKRFSNLHSHSSIKFDITEEKMITLIDEKQFSRVLNNIIKNAEQSIPDELKANITMSVEKENKMVKITISDNGCGIKEEEINKVFEPKFTTKTGGMGLGLGIARNIIKSIDGEISFETEINKGTIFYISIPLTVQQ